MPGAFKRALVYSGYAVLVLAAVTLAAVSTVLVSETGSRWLVNYGITRLNQAPGLSISVASLNGNLLRGLRMSRVSVSSPQLNFSAATLDLNWNPYSLLAGDFTVNHLRGSELIIESQAGDSDEPFSVSMPPLPVAVSVDAAEIDRISIRAAGQLVQLQSLGFSLQIAGSQLRLQELQLETDQLSLAGSMNAELRDELPLSANLAWRYRGELLQPFSQAAGELELTGNSNRLQLRHQLSAPYQVLSSGTLLQPLDGMEMTFDLVHQANQLQPPAAWELPVSLSPTTLATRGRLDAVALSLESVVDSEWLPPTAVTAETMLRTGELQDVSARFSSATATLTYSGAVSFADGLGLAGRYQFSDERPLQTLGLEAPFVLERVSSGGSVEFSANGANLGLVIESFSGQLEQYPVSAQGRLGYADGRLLLESLEVQTEDNFLTVSGRYGADMELSWRLQAPALGQLLSAVQGAATGAGSISGDFAQPEIAGSLQLRGLAAMGVAISEADLQVAGNSGSLRADASITDVQFPGASADQAIQSATLTFAGNLQRHSLDAMINATMGDLRTSLTGGFADLAARRWQGLISDAAISGITGAWQQSAPGSIELDGDRLTLADSCWRQQTIEICLGIDPRPDGLHLLRADAERLPLAWLAASGEHPVPRPPVLDSLALLPANVLVDGLADLGAELRVGANGIENLAIAGVAADAVMTVLRQESDPFAIPGQQQATESQDYRWQQFNVDASFADGSWQFAVLAHLDQQDLQASGQDLDGVLELELGLGPDAELSGSTTVAFQDIGWLEAFIPELSAIRGNLQGELQVFGSSQDPQLAGSIILDQGSFFAERLGVNYTDLQARLTSQSSELALVEGSIQSPQGSLEFSGSLQHFLSQARRLSLQLRGSDFLLGDLPDLELRVSPDLSLVGTAQLFHVEGSLAVPYLDLRMTQLPETAIDVSRDVVIVDYPDDRPELSQSLAGAQASFGTTPISARVQVELGDEVRFSGFGLTATVRGLLDMEQFATGTNRTYGEVSVLEGSYQTYGQSLALREGKLIFLGNLDNPALELRAVREVGDTTVGVMMNGTLKNMQSQLFSTPVLADADIISVLVTGRPFAELRSDEGEAVLGAVATLGLEQGAGLTSQISERLGVDSIDINTSGSINNAELTVGKFVTPEVFIRYGIGLFDRQSKVAVDYYLTDRLQLQAESGEFQSVDLLYRVER